MRSLSWFMSYFCKCYCEKGTVQFSDIDSYVSSVTKEEDIISVCYVDQSHGAVLHFSKTYRVFKGKKA